MRTWDKPPTIETYAVHPFMEQVDAAAGEGGGEAEKGGEAADPPGRPLTESSSRRFGQLSGDGR